MNKVKRMKYNNLSQVISEAIDDSAEKQQRINFLEDQYNKLQAEYDLVLEDYLKAINEKLDLEEEVMELRHSEDVKQQTADWQAEARRENFSE